MPMSQQSETSLNFFSLFTVSAKQPKVLVGEFNSVDSLPSDGMAVWSNDHNMFLPHSQAANAQDEYVSQFAAGTASLGSDGSLYWLSGAGGTYAPMISFIGNVSGSVSSRTARLFGQATIFTTGQATSPVSPRVYNVNYVAALKAVGSASTRRLVVCLSTGNTSVISPVYLASGLSNSGQFQNPDPLPPQLVEYSTAGFFAKGQVNKTPFNRGTKFRMRKCCLTPFKWWHINIYVHQFQY